MDSSTFPDAVVTKYIESLAKEFSLDIKSVSVETKTLSFGNTNPFDEWMWVLNKAGSTVRIELRVDYPDYYSNVSIANEGPKNGYIPNFFFLKEYLSKSIGAHGDVQVMNSVVKNKTWKTDWSVPFEILKSHLRTDLKEVIEGKSWPTVYFDMADYVEPEALDRLHNDQVNRIEAKSKTKRGWLHFLKIKKDK